MTTDIDSKSTTHTKYAVPALEKGLDILEYLANQSVPMTQAQLARALGRQPGELFRMLSYLEQRGYLYRDQASGGYSLTLKLFELGRRHSPHDALITAALPLMDRLTEDIREPCHLSVLHRDRLLVLAQSESPNPFRLSVEVGSMHSPVTTVSGRLLLAHMSAATLDAYLERQPDYLMLTSSQRAQFLQRLALIRERGFDHSDSERFIGWLDLGVLIGAKDSHTQATLTLVALKRPEMTDLMQALPKLFDYAAQIASKAGLSG